MFELLLTPVLQTRTLTTSTSCLILLSTIADLPRVYDWDRESQDPDQIRDFDPDRPQRGRNQRNQRNQLRQITYVGTRPRLRSESTTREELEAEEARRRRDTEREDQNRQRQIRARELDIKRAAYQEAERLKAKAKQRERERKSSERLLQAPLRTPTKDRILGYRTPRNWGLGLRSALPRRSDSPRRYIPYNNRVSELRGSTRLPSIQYENKASPSVVRDHFGINDRIYDNEQERTQRPTLLQQRSIRRSTASSNNNV